MNVLLSLTNRLSLLSHTLYFIRKHLLVLVGLGLIAAVGRVIQLGGFGPITSGFHIFLEVIIEVARGVLFVYVLGLASLKHGASRIKHLFTDKSSRKHYWRVALQKGKKQWAEILLNFLLFLGIAWVFNYLIDTLAYQTCLYLALKKNEIISQTSSEWTIILFFKNLSVIPFTLTFQALFLLWIINKSRGQAIVKAVQPK
ncbi:hypothetical protein [Telluribacter humicola]|uniref:hypothetical protein n=1 Tax=Telluribacter humicola TaxID=1720261 RepID=UPI001A96289A|nr:hypothetical protein [Telluribacter humicola]